MDIMAYPDRQAIAAPHTHRRALVGWTAIAAPSVPRAVSKPCCPRCGDGVRVLKLSRVYRSLQRRAAHDASARARAALFAPPCPPHAAGRWFALALVCGVVLWVATGFAAVWPALGVCLGVMGEIALLFEHEHRHVLCQPALERWASAYYCAVHDRVLLASPRYVCTPEAFARLLRRPAPDVVQLAPSSLRQPARAGRS